MAKVRVCGHRGAASRAPENTLAGIALARSLGVERVEVDLRLTRDEEVVLHHDRDLGRTDNGRGPVREADLEHLQTLDAGSWFDPGFRDQRIPSLGDLLAASGRVLCWNLELKTDGDDSAVRRQILKDAVLTGIAAPGIFPRVLITSFDHDLIREILSVARAPRCGFIFGHHVPVPADHATTAAVFSMQHDLITADGVARAHDAGKEVHAWTVNDRVTLERMAAMGVDEVISDDPGLMLALL